MLFVLAGVQWHEQVDWEHWRDSARALGRDHPTVARDYRPVPAVGPRGDPLTQSGGAGEEGSGGASFAVIRQAHGPLLDQVAAAIRVRGLAIRTERMYLHWIMRFIGFQGNRGSSSHDCAQGRLRVYWRPCACSSSGMTRACGLGKRSTTQAGSLAWLA